ncbi:ParM/StbA family protein [uncultured Clostridium sp.]|uniref:ParM/StbA family protein n=1 Tax=uncultured Clostridium sp. TaxID=59620 RepID=UPI002613368E|nr:ParM/StbA family protein [uncultured Clostridium sp.]
MKLVVVDLGSFNIKTNKGVILENRFTLDNESETFGAEVLSYDGNNYFFGRGEFNKTFSKAHKEIEVPLFYSLAKSEVYGDVNLILHLPANQMKMKGLIIEKLKGKEFNYRVNNIEYKTIFNKVGVLKEGWSSFYSLNKRNEGLIAVMDIGGRTTDVFTFNNGINEDEKSLSIGMMNVFSDIADKLNGQGENRKLEDIHKLLVNKIIDINDFQEVINKYADKIINEIKVNIENLKDYKIYLTGGGAEYFKEALSRVFNVEIMENNLCSNCNGSYNIGKAKGLDK